MKENASLSSILRIYLLESNLSQKCHGTVVSKLCCPLQSLGESLKNTGAWLPPTRYFDLTLMGAIRTSRFFKALQVNLMCSKLREPLSWSIALEDTQPHEANRSNEGQSTDFFISEKKKVFLLVVKTLLMVSIQY